MWQGIPTEMFCAPIECVSTRRLLCQSCATLMCNNVAHEAFARLAHGITRSDDVAMSWLEASKFFNTIIAR